MHLYACVCILCTWDAFMALLSQDLMMFNTFTSQSQTIRCSWHIFSSCDPTCVILMLPNFTLQYPEQSCIQIDHVMSKKLRLRNCWCQNTRGPNFTSHALAACWPKARWVDYWSALLSQLKVGIDWPCVNLLCGKVMGAAKKSHGFRRKAVRQDTVHIWRFPKMGGTPKSSILRGCSIINYSPSAG